MGTLIPSTAGASASNPCFLLLITTSLETKIAIVLSREYTVGELKKKIETDHCLTFPEMGEIIVRAFEVLIKDSFYRLSDSVPVWQTFYGSDDIRFFRVEASIKNEPKDHGTGYTGSLLVEHNLQQDDVVIGASTKKLAGETVHFDIVENSNSKTKEKVKGTIQMEKGVPGINDEDKTDLSVSLKQDNLRVDVHDHITDVIKSGDTPNGDQVVCVSIGKKSHKRKREKELVNKLSTESKEAITDHFYQSEMQDTKSVDLKIAKKKHRKKKKEKTSVKSDACLEKNSEDIIGNPELDGDDNSKKNAKLMPALPLSLHETESAYAAVAEIGNICREISQNASLTPNKITTAGLTGQYADRSGTCGGIPNGNSTVSSNKKAPLFNPEATASETHTNLAGHVNPDESSDHTTKKRKRKYSKYHCEAVLRKQQPDPENAGIETITSLPEVVTENPEESSKGHTDFEENTRKKVITREASEIGTCLEDISKIQKDNNKSTTNVSKKTVKTSSNPQKSKSHSTVLEENTNVQATGQEFADPGTRLEGMPKVPTNRSTQKSEKKPVKISKKSKKKKSAETESLVTLPQRPIEVVDGDVHQNEVGGTITKDDPNATYKKKQLSDPEATAVETIAALPQNVTGNPEESHGCQTDLEENTREKVIAQEASETGTCLEDMSKIQIIDNKCTININGETVKSSNPQESKRHRTILEENTNVQATGQEFADPGTRIEGMSKVPTDRSTQISKKKKVKTSKKPKQKEPIESESLVSLSQITEKNSELVPSDHVDMDKQSNIHINFHNLFTRETETKETETGENLHYAKHTENSNGRQPHNSSSGAGRTSSVLDQKSDLMLDKTFGTDGSDTSKEQRRNKEVQSGKSDDKKGQQNAEVGGLFSDSESPNLLPGDSDKNVKSHNIKRKASLSSCKVGGIVDSKVKASKSKDRISSYSSDVGKDAVADPPAKKFNAPLVASSDSTEDKDFKTGHFRVAVRKVPGKVLEKVSDITQQTNADKIFENDSSDCSEDEHEVDDKNLTSKHKYDATTTSSESEGTYTRTQVLKGNLGAHASPARSVDVGDCAVDSGMPINEDVDAEMIISHGNDTSSPSGSSKTEWSIHPSIDPNLVKDKARRAKSRDPGWKYALWPDIDNRNSVQCLLCAHISKGGIMRLKDHLIGGFPNVISCSKSTEAIREEMIKWKQFRRKK